MDLISTCVDILDLRAWSFKTTCIDRRIPLYEGAFFFTRTMLFPPLDKRNTRDKARGLCITSEGYIRELGVRCLSTLNREQDSHATVSYRSARQPIIGCFAPIHRERSIPEQERGMTRQQGGISPFLWSEQTAENKHTKMNSVQLPFSFFITR